MTPPSVPIPIPIPILLYHSVAPDWTPAYEPWCVHPDRFDEHLEVIVGLGHTPLTISELVDAVAEDRLPDRPIAVTFDDGRADFTEHAVPGLVARDVPATLYVVTGQIGRTSAWLPMSDERDARMMEWDDVRVAASIVNSVEAPPAAVRIQRVGQVPDSSSFASRACHVTSGASG